jgi:hypothetical protein
VRQRAVAERQRVLQRIAQHPAPAHQPLPIRLQPLPDALVNRVRGAQVALARADIRQAQFHHQPLRFAQRRVVPQGLQRLLRLADAPQLGELPRAGATDLHPQFAVGVGVGVRLQRRQRLLRGVQRVQQPVL